MGYEVLCVGNPSDKVNNLINRDLTNHLNWLWGGDTIISLNYLIHFTEHLGQTMPIVSHHTLINK